MLPLNINFDPILLSRLQFAFTISFHIIFPALTIGLASWLAIVEALWLKTRDDRYLDIYKFWIKIFSVAFGMGVVSGVVMSYQFGTNWALFVKKVGNVIGPLLGFEVLTAFFLEASFLGIMLFGWGRVSERMHFASSVIVAIGTVISAFWILSANSWMHTPAGFRIDNHGIFYPTNWLEIIFNPSFINRFLHMVTAAYITAGFVVLAVASFYLLKKKHEAHAQIMFSMAIGLIIILVPLQMIFGHLSGVKVLDHQPLKIAAMEGLWESTSRAPMALIAIPDQEKEKNDFAIEIPLLSSLIVTHSLSTELKGLKEWPKKDRPPVAWVFWSFRVMVGVGLLMLFTAIIAAFLHRKHLLFESPIFFKWCILMGPSGFIALLAGWYATEIGRQPYVVYDLVRTAEVVSPVEGRDVALSLVIFVIVYFLLFGTGIYYIFELIKKGITPKLKTEELFYSHGLKTTPVITDIESKEDKYD